MLSALICENTPPASSVPTPRVVLVQVQLPSYSWQALRALVRAEVAGLSSLTGAEMRLTPSALTKDGQFLDQLVRHGLVAVAAKAPPLKEVTDEERKKPAQFRTRYRLTDKGRHAAEYGKYDLDVAPRVTKLRGLAAEVFEIAERRKRTRGRKR